MRVGILVEFDVLRIDAIREQFHKGYYRIIIRFEMHADIGVLQCRARCVVKPKQRLASFRDVDLLYARVIPGLPF